MKWQNELALAIQAANDAASYLSSQRTRVGQDGVVSAEGRDIKLYADLESEKIILHTLKENSEYPILTEESGELGSVDYDSELFWVIDPLDGSLNFIKGLPLCCVSIALWHKTEPVLGVVYDFVHDELFTGIVGEGAYLNECPISVSSTDSVNQAILATGFPAFRSFDDASLMDFLMKVQRFKKVRLLGSAALSLAYVACGRTDAYAEEDIMIWDVAGGIALVKAAGGCIIAERSKNMKWALNVQVAGQPAIWRGLNKESDLL